MLFDLHQHQLTSPAEKIVPIFKKLILIKNFIIIFTKQKICNKL